MRYVSTRGQAAELGFRDVLLEGLATDGGLYMPAEWPELGPSDWRALRGHTYAELAAELLWPFVSEMYSQTELSDVCRRTYAGFAHPATAPLVQLAPNLFLAELHWGPTLAFKDFALQLVGRMFDDALASSNKRLTVVGATSGDTGSAAIEACKGRERISVFILHPHGRVSEVQRRQMTTVPDANVFNIAIEGTFDDCQDIVKALFADAEFRRDTGMSAVNSINWARVLAQVVYYAYAALALGAPDREVDFAVPTGNFGNVLAGWAARRMGLPIRKLVVGSNRNDILTRFFANNDMSVAGVQPSLSPSMDIQVSSNFERLLFELSGRDTAQVSAQMTAFRSTGRLEVPQAWWAQAREIFAGAAVSDDETLETIRATWSETGNLIDPHTAVGLAAARKHHSGDRVSTVVLATAHPAKFPDAVQTATGVRPALPPRLAHLYSLPERFTVMPNDSRAVGAWVRAALQR
jgi:threonine synthase